VRISAQLSVILAAIIAAVCFGVAITGFASLGDVEDPVRRSDSLGFACFWTFLGAIAAVFGAIGVWLVRTQKDGDA